MKYGVEPKRQIKLTTSWIVKLDSLSDIFFHGLQWLMTFSWVEPGPTSNRRTLRAHFVIVFF